jgi:RNA polymerase sigma-70 factor (ECF subfamily)
MEKTRNMPEAQSDESLVELVINGDKAAFDELMQRYQSKAYRLVRGILRDHQDTEEVLQEIFLKIFQKLDTFRGEASFSSWLYRVALNTAFMKLREKKRPARIPLDNVIAEIEELEATGAEWPSAPDQEIVTEEVMKIITEAMEKMPEDFRVILILRDIEGFSNEEVGELLNLSVPAVKSRVHRARLFLRKRLDDFYKQHI